MNLVTMVLSQIIGDGSAHVHNIGSSPVVVVVLWWGVVCYQETGGGHGGSVASHG